MDKSKRVTATFLSDLSHLPTAYFALVMATGIVSIASYYLEFFALAELLCLLCMFIIYRVKVPSGLILARTVS